MKKVPPILPKVPLQKCINMQFCLGSTSVVRVVVREIHVSTKKPKPYGMSVAPVALCFFISLYPRAYVKHLSNLMIIRNHVIAPRRGNKLQAQGNALGKEKHSQRPERAKALTGSNAFALQGEHHRLSIPGAMPWAGELVGLSCVPLVASQQSWSAGLFTEGYRRVWQSLPLGGR